MKLTNKNNLPHAIYNSCLEQNKKYSKGDADYSVTGLLKPPTISRLTKEHYDELTEDCSERLWALSGSALHHILEMSADENTITEKRLFAEINGVKISGSIDVLENKTIQDYKYASVWESIYGIKPEKVEQLNIYYWLCYKNGIEVDSLELVFMFRDWQASKAEHDANYPQSQIAVIPVEIWSIEKIESFIIERIKLQQDENYICTAEDRWRNGEKWAVMKLGRKSAIKLHDTVEEADRHLQTLDDKHYIEHREGKDARCERYCPVRNFCPHNKML